MRMGMGGNIALGLCSIAAALYFYVFLVCALSPDRFHILKHDGAEDAQRYFTAWSSAAAACLLYACAAGVLWALKLSERGPGQSLAQLRASGPHEQLASAYELENLSPKNA